MHDKNGNPIKKGDKVTVVAEIIGTNASPDYCNVTLQVGFEDAHGPHNVRSQLVVNAKQVELLEAAPETAGE